MSTCCILDANSILMSHLLLANPMAIFIGRLRLVIPQPVVGSAASVQATIAALNEWKILLLRSSVLIRAVHTYILGAHLGTPLTTTDIENVSTRTFLVMMQQSAYLIEQAFLSAQGWLLLVLA